MSKTAQTYQRFSVSQRIEHVILILSFTTLALTGLAQKYATAGISEFIIMVFGGIQTARIIHRIAATVFVAQSIIHFLIAGYKLYVRRMEATMLPKVKDARDAIQAFQYNLGLSKDRPKMPRYNFTEKAEYWAMVWGLVLMGITGFMLWNPLITTKFLPGVVIPAAKIAHGLEAVLAVLAILLWHFYNVHIKDWNWSMVRGKLTRHQMEEEHAEELAKIEAGVAAPPKVSAAERRRRERVYFPVAGILTLALFGGLIWLVTAETTAIETITPVEEDGGAVFSPAVTLTPLPAATSPATATVGVAPQPTATVGVAVQQATATVAAPAAALTWNSEIGALFQSKCAACHGATNGAGGVSLDSYANTIASGSVVANNPDGSSVVAVQQQGGHPGQFSAEELQQVIDWISAGAPEN